ncbi:MAG: nitroreductase family protein [Methanomicrobiaceae archaeon]|nr:nitroreductase family protein [Methanomicrobiaceae archaeon]
MNIGITIIKSRRSVRQYRPAPVPSDVINDALECARHAPTANNGQKWLFGVITEKDLLASIADLTDHGTFIADAPVCFAVFGERDWKYYLEDCCAATEQLMLGLWAHGVGSCWVAGDKKDYAGEVGKLLQVPADYTLVSLIPAGYPEDMKLVPKKPLEDILFANRWSPKGT